MSSIVCGCRQCINHDHEKRTCKLSVVFIDADGSCGDRETPGNEENPSDDDIVQE